MKKLKQNNTWPIERRFSIIFQALEDPGGPAPDAPLQSVTDHHSNGEANCTELRACPQRNHLSAITHSTIINWHFNKHTTIKIKIKK